MRALSFNVSLMHRPVRQRLAHAVPQWVCEGSFFFITINCAERGNNQLCQAGLGDAVLAALANYHERCVWHCRVALLMPDHLHGIIAFPHEPGLKTTIIEWKRFLSRTQKISWQRDFFDHRLRDHHQETEKMNYVLMNPVRKGLCERAEDWPWVYRPTDRPPPKW